MSIKKLSNKEYFSWQVNKASYMTNIIAKVKPDITKVGPLLHAVIPQPEVRCTSSLDC